MGGRHSLEECLGHMEGVDLVRLWHNGCLRRLDGTVRHDCRVVWRGVRKVAGMLERGKKEGTMGSGKGAGPVICNGYPRETGQMGSGKAWGFLGKARTGSSYARARDDGTVALADQRKTYTRTTG